MKVAVTAYPLLTEHVPVTLFADVDTKEEAFDLAMRQWSDDLESVHIEEVVDHDYPRTWTLTWPLLPKIERIPNDYCDVGYHLVSALINGDVSGIDAEDEHHLEDFIEQYPNCVFEPDEGESFAKCEVTEKYNNCVRMKVYAR
jgi:hypothetical protein